MTIDDLYTKLLPFAGKPLSIPGTVFPATDNIAAFCSNLLNGNAMVIDVKSNGVVESADKQTLTLSGSTSSYGFDTFDISLVFTMNMGQYNADISIDLSSQSLKLPGISWFAISHPSFDFKVSNASLPVIGTISGEVTINSETLTISMDVPITSGYWAFQVKFDPSLSIAAIVAFVGGGNIAGALQSPFTEIVSDLGVLQIGFVCDTINVKRISTSILIGTPTSGWNGWPLAPGVTLTAADLLMNIDDANAIAYNISSSLTIEGIDLSLSANFPGPGQGWTFNGQTQEGEHISLTGLFNDVCSLWHVALPSNFPSISFTNISFSFNTLNKSFLFGGELDITNSAKFSIAGKQFEIRFILQVYYASAAAGSTYSGSLTGIFSIGSVFFELLFDFNNTDKQLSGLWKETGSDTLNIADIANKFGNSDLIALLQDIPPSMDLGLQSASFTYDFTNSELVLTAVSKNYGNVVFLAAQISGSWVFAFMVGISKIDLTQLPLVGTELGKLGTFEIDNLNLLVCSASIDQTNIGKLNALITKAATLSGAQLPMLPDTAAGLQKGVNLSMTFNAAGFSIPVQVGTASVSGSPHSSISTFALPASTGLTAGPGSSTVPAANACWINIQKALGPVYIDKVGFTYQDGNLECLFNFSLKLGALNITLNGLMVGSSLSAFHPVFGLQGLSLTFNSGAVEISGGFIKENVGGITEYNGEAMIKAGTFMLSAMGSYAKLANGDTSLFIFASINDPLGGPPYLFVTGIAAGFGYNRGLKIPTIDQVPTFPLVSGFVPGQSSPFSGGDPGAALQVLVSQNVVPVEPGQNWLAAGIQFSSFEMIQSFALVAVEFGASLEIALLGMSTASVPTGDPNPLIFAQLALDVRILPDEGLIAVDAELTSSSYLLDPACHLTGGFAFYIWFGNNANAGDFVVTLGGYNPNFKAPSYYPKVPQLGFNWVVTPELTIKGGMYFALTPTCLMAGGDLQALWQSGELKAWFDMGADFLIAWKPYHYSADLYLSFGVSYTFKIDLLFATVTETISVSLGADLSIWGPSFSGVAHIHLWIISFSVSFGAGASQAPPPIAWSDFEQSFLPKGTSGSQRSVAQNRHSLAESIVSNTTDTDSVCSSSVSSGLVKDLSPGTDNPQNIDWIVNRHGTVITTTAFTPSKTYSISIKNNNGTQVPASQIAITNADDLNSRNITFGVGPVGITPEDFSSVHAIELVYNDGVFSHELVFNITASIQTVPKALWQHGSPDISSDTTLISDVLMGFSISTAEVLPDQTPLVDSSLLGTKDYTYTPTLKWSAPQVISGPPQPSNPITQLEQSILNPAGRPSILQALLANGFDVDTNVDVSHIAVEAGSFLLAPPVFGYDYWKQ